jgi:hypothetical protein
MEWQTIDTAPRDGTAILLWGGVPDNRSEEYYTGFDPIRPVSGWWDVDAEYNYPAIGACGHYGCLSGSPTHWMLLPAPPRAE